MKQLVRMNPFHKNLMKATKCSTISVSGYFVNVWDLKRFG